MKEVICTCCPQGCHLQVDEANDYKVTGNGCPNGIAYGKDFVNNKYFGFEVGSNGKTQTNCHTGRITFGRSIDITFYA